MLDFSSKVHLDLCLRLQFPPLLHLLQHLHHGAPHARASFVEVTVWVVDGLTVSAKLQLVVEDDPAGLRHGGFHDGRVSLESISWCSVQNSIVNQRTANDASFDH